MFDITTMLLGAAAAGIGVCLTMLTLWSADRSEPFKVNWTVGVVFLIAHVFAYWVYATTSAPTAGIIACALQPVGAAFLYASVRQFTDPRYRILNPVLWISIPYLLVVPPIFAIGYDGIALVIQNALTATLLIISGIIYVTVRKDAPLAIGGLALLYLLAGVSFALCGMVILFEQQWSIGHAPENWAEELNVLVAVLALSGAGALTLSVDQTRLAKQNQLSAISDPLSGLLNRRGFETRRPEVLREDEAALMFDLDNFKNINDRYGHAAGDEAIRHFADTLRKHGRAGDVKARLGGEEFVILMSGVSPKEARSVAERILDAFSSFEIVSENGERFSCSVSGGIAFGHRKGASIDDVMTRADNALYSAKRAGRNRVESGELRLVS